MDISSIQMILYVVLVVYLTSRVYAHVDPACKYSYSVFRLPCILPEYIVNSLKVGCMLYDRVAE